MGIKITSFITLGLAISEFVVYVIVDIILITIKRSRKKEEEFH